MGNKIASFMTTISNEIYEFIDIVLEVISYNLLPDKPTLKLASDNLQIQQRDLRFFERICEFIHESVALCIMPIELLINKKFTFHMYETANVFSLQNNQSTHNVVSICDKMMMYISQNINKISEPRHKQVIKTVLIGNNECDVPVNQWYKFEISSKIKVYFNIQCSVHSNYKGIIIAANGKCFENLSLIKDKAIDFYDQTLSISHSEIFDNRKNFI